MKSPTIRRRKLIDGQKIEKELADGGLLISRFIAHPNQILPTVRYWLPLRPHHQPGTVADRAGTTTGRYRTNALTLKTPTTTHHQRENEHVQQQRSGIRSCCLLQASRRCCAQYFIRNGCKKRIHHHSFHEIKKPPCPSPCRPPFSLAPHGDWTKPCPEEATRMRRASTISFHARHAATNR